MPKILTVIGRNLRIYSNSKLSSLIIIMGPLILILIMGAALQDSSLRNIQAGVFSSEESEFKEDFTNRLNEESFLTIPENSLESCKENVINGINHVCIHIEKGDSPEIFPGKLNYDVDVYVDFSKQRIVWGIISSLQNMVDKESHSIRNSVIKDIKSDVNKIYSRLINIENRLTSATSNIDSLEQKGADAKNELDDIETRVLNIKEDLETLRDSEELDEQQILIISGLINEIDLINQKIRNVEEGIIPETEVRRVRKSVLDIQEAVRNLRGELSRIQEISVDQLIDPVILSVYSASNDVGGEATGQRLELLDYLFPSFLIFFVLFGSLLFSTMITTKERSSNAYIRNITSKVFGATFIMGNLLTVLIITTLQISIIIFVASFFLNLSILPNILSLIYLILISILIFSLIGMSIGYIFNSHETAIIASISISLLFLIFSSIITPTETLPGILPKIVSLSPLALLETKLRISLIFDSAIGLNLIEIISLASVAIIFSLIIGIFYKKNKEKEI